MTFSCLDMTLNEQSKCVYIIHKSWLVLYFSYQILHEFPVPQQAVQPLSGAEKEVNRMHFTCQIQLWFSLYKMPDLALDVRLPWIEFQETHLNYLKLIYFVVREDFFLHFLSII